MVAYMILKIQIRISSIRMASEGTFWKYLGRSRSPLYGTPVVISAPRITGWTVLDLARNAL